MFALELGAATPEELSIARARLLVAKWEIVVGRDYQTFDVTEGSGYYRAFFLKLPPHSALHRHVDAGDIHTDHIVIQTNPQALNWWMEDNEECCEHLRQGYRYKVDRKVLHWAVNDGETDRIHLLLEYR